MPSPLNFMLCSLTKLVFADIDIPGLAVAAWDYLYGLPMPGRDVVDVDLFAAHQAGGVQAPAAAGGHAKDGVAFAVVEVVTAAGAVLNGGLSRYKL
jgi:hypothetical protein